MSGESGRRVGPCCGLIGLLEQSETERKEFCSPPVGEEAEVADAHEAAWQQVKQEATQKLIDRQSHDPLPVVVSGISPAELNMAVSEGKQSVVGDGDAMGVGAKIAENVFWTTERRLAVDHPVLAEQ